VHELSLASAVLATVEKHAEGRPVKVVNLKVGHLRQVVPESLGFYFGIVARGTIWEGAKLEQTVVTALLRCSACGCEWEPDFPMFRCPACAKGDVVVLQGDEFQVETIEVEEGRACTAPK
jgi:hydrogenase nickel incorporation protein HypA/HybF